MCTTRDRRRLVFPRLWPNRCLQLLDGVNETPGRPADDESLGPIPPATAAYK